MSYVGLKKSFARNYRLAKRKVPLELRKDIKKASSAIYKGGMKIGKATIQREVQRARKPGANQLRLPRDINSLTDF